jgi:putative toxin-antitoxin system, toxin component
MLAVFYGKPLEQIVPMERKELDWSRAEGAEVFSVSNPYTIPELLEILSPIFRANGVRKATLFGSYARGLATARSDVDLLVDSGLHGLAFFGLLEQVSEALDAPVDLIDVSQVDAGSELVYEIEKHGIVLFEQ